MAFLENAIMCILKKRKKKDKLNNHDCLPISMLLYIILCIMLTYLMLFAALSNAVCLYNAFFGQLIFAIAFFHSLSWFIDIWFVYFKYDFASCTVLLICWFSKFYVHTVFYMKGLCALWRNIT